MGIDVTDFVSAYAEQFFDLCHGPGAWALALEAARLVQDSPQYGSNMLEAARAHFAEYGAWTRQELAAFFDLEICAMIAQDIAACAWEHRAPNDGLSDRLNYGFDGERAFFYLGV